VAPVKLAHANLEKKKNKKSCKVERFVFTCVTMGEKEAEQLKRGFEQLDGSITLGGASGCDCYQ
jgi:hypothetical protein